MFVCKSRTPSWANYEYFHVYLAYRRQTGTVVTHQTYDRAPRLTNHPLYTFQGVMMKAFAGDRRRDSLVVNKLVEEHTYLVNS